MLSPKSIESWVLLPWPNHTTNDSTMSRWPDGGCGQLGAEIGPAELFSTKEVVVVPGMSKAIFLRNALMHSFQVLQHLVELLSACHCVVAAAMVEVSLVMFWNLGAKDKRGITGSESIANSTANRPNQ